MEILTRKISCSRGKRQSTVMVYEENGKQAREEGKPLEKNVLSDLLLREAKNSVYIEDRHRVKRFS